MVLKTLAAAATTIAIAVTGTALAQLPPGVFAGQRDLKSAAAGTYLIDPDHTAVIAKVSHIGYALSVFRFTKVAGELTWNPAQPSHSALTASVETASISTPVAGFATERAGDAYLKSAAFKQARFVSTRFHEIDSTHGTVDGNFTLLGKTVPVTFEVELMGAGKGFMGHARIGIEATTKIDPQQFGLSPMLGDSIILIIDGEFAAQAK